MERTNGLIVATALALWAIALVYLMDRPNKMADPSKMSSPAKSAAAMAGS